MQEYQPRRKGVAIAWATSPRPQPAERSRGQQAIHQPVDDLLQDHAPRLALPDAVAEHSQTVSHERCGASDAKDDQIVHAGRKRAPREIGGEEPDHEAIAEPQAEKLRQGGRPAGKYGHEADRPLLVFFLHSGRLHVLVAAIWEHIETAL